MVRVRIVENWPGKLAGADNHRAGYPLPLPERATANPVQGRINTSETTEINILLGMLRLVFAHGQQALSPVQIAIGEQAICL